MFFMTMLFILLSNHFFGLFNYNTIQRLLLVIFCSLAIILYGVKKSKTIWDKNAIKFDGIDSVITEIKNDELKKLILKGEKIMAVKKYRAITGSKLKEALRYVDLIDEYYSNNESKF